MQSPEALRFVDLCRLDAEAVRKGLARSEVSGVRAPYEAGMLACVPPEARFSLAPDFSFVDASGLVTLSVPLGRALEQGGMTCWKAREALVTEVQYLALVLGTLVDDFAPQMFLGMLGRGERPPIPDSARLALVYDFREQEATVLKLGRGAQAHPLPAADERRLVLGAFSDREPEEYLRNGLDWLRLTPPEPVDVLLVSMPFAPVVQPSLGLGLLKATLPPGIAKVLYLSLVFARRIGRPLYHWLGDQLPFATTLAGEWLFRPALFPSVADNSRGYLEEVLLAPTRQWRESACDEPTNSTLVCDGLVADILEVRDLVDSFLDHCVDQVLAHRPRIVGLTSVFQQQVASLALAQRLKARSPETRVVLGGSNCEGVMGLATMRAFDFLDAVVSGEGEIILPQLVDRWLSGKPVDDLRGVYTAASPEVKERSTNPANAPSPRHLDDLPYPDFDDFFAQFERSGFVEGMRSKLLFETSRGCWWGEKKHCTFCGLNGATMMFRSKSAERALAELRWLTERFPGRGVSMVDNILDMRYFTNLLPSLAEEPLPVELFYEVKSNLKKDQIRLLRAAGVTSVQPGIESFSDPVLQLMGKGVKGLQNIRLLKWCQELGVWPYWNLLWGFPGEPPEEYAWMAELIPLLHHLPPPVAISPIFLERFSPNYFRSDEIGFADVRRMPAYDYIYDVPPDDCEDMAFFFEYAYQDGRDVEPYVKPLVPRVAEWRDIYSGCTLAAVDRGDHLLICDTRPMATESVTVVEGFARTLLLLCDDITTVDQLQRNVGMDGSSSRIEAALEPLVERGILLRRGEAVLSLAVARSLRA